MQTFLATLVLFGLAVLAMGLGVLIQGRRLKGSCGGTGKDCMCSPLSARSCETRRRRSGEAASPS